jgi:hypothetical protein
MAFFYVYFFIALVFCFFIYTDVIYFVRLCFEKLKSHERILTAISIFLTVLLSTAWPFVLLFYAFKYRTKSLCFYEDSEND